MVWRGGKGRKRGWIPHKKFSKAFLCVKDKKSTPPRGKGSQKPLSFRNPGDGFDM
jgi:hypothetical protein